jgi:predicted transcriptional regulator
MSLDSVKKAEEIEKALTSSGKLKILRLLTKTPDHAFTRYEIRKKLPLSPTDIRNDLKTLVDLNWIKENKIQHLQKYSINLDNTLVEQLSDFFKKIKYI